MKYTPAFEFLRNYLKNIGIHCCLISKSSYQISYIDQGLREYLYQSSMSQSDFSMFLPTIVSRTLYYVEDDYDCHYVFFELPDSVYGDSDDSNEANLFVAGPFSTEQITDQQIETLLENLSFPTNFAIYLHRYFTESVCVVDRQLFTVLMATFAEQIWGGSTNYQLENIHLGHTNFSEPVLPQIKFSQGTDTTDPLVVVRALEERYEIENGILNAIAIGDEKRALMQYGLFMERGVEKRVPNPLMNRQNYSIVLNTLFRKAAERAGVHPIYLDRISSKFSIEISRAESVEALPVLHRKMLRQYCMLVRNHSMKGFSPAVQKILTMIDVDLASDLTLSRFAEALNVNASHLSATFKKETGSTLTDYVNQKRISHAIYLLNTTDLQIQTIAEQCGINDVAYFTKIFKKIVGKTPKAYRKDIGV